jgi:hypothetical protein
LSISVALSRAIRLLAFVALLFGGVAGHDVAMAGGPMGSMHSQTDLHPDISGHSEHSAPSPAGCEEYGCPCCLSGHCLLGIPPGAECEFETAIAPDPVAITPSGLVAQIAWVPFRPPVSG